MRNIPQPADTASDAQVIDERIGRLSEAFEAIHGNVIDAEVDLSRARKWTEEGRLARASEILSAVADSLRAAQRVDLGEGART